MEKEPRKFHITGMSCAACAAHVEKGVRKVEGVSDVSVNLLRNSMQVTCDASVADETIVAAVVAAGYGATAAAKSAGRNETEQAASGGKASVKGQWVRLIVSVGVLLVLMYVSMGHMVGLPLPPFLRGDANAMSFALVQFLLTLVVAGLQFGFFRSGIRALFRGAPNMDTLVCLGAGAAFAYGVAALFVIGYGLGHGNMSLAHRYAHDLYFESTATILTLVSVGKYLESRSKGKAGEAVDKLLDLSPKTAVWTDGVTEREIPASELVPGDLVLVRPGMGVPADGVAVKGEASIDESAVTGESVPAEKGAGDHVTGGTVVRSGVLTVEVRAVGEDTTLRQIARLVEQASGSKAPIARLADKVSAVFVPAVLGIALVTLVVWWIISRNFSTALGYAVSVMVISCPCALGLATPTAITVATGRGANLGILYKTAAAIERAESIDAVVLDKTGTVTTGKPTVTDALCDDSKAALCDILSLERNSEHPFALALCAYATELGGKAYETTEFFATAGGGVTARAGDKTLVAGNAKLCGDYREFDRFAAVGKVWAEQGKTPLYLVVDGVVTAVFALADVVKEDSRAAVAEVRAGGCEVYMLTGDNAAVAAAVAKDAGIEQFRAEVMPQDKERFVRTLREAGKRVAMVGDGINDAPALAAADLGIAIGAGTDIAIDAADVVLVRSRLGDAAAALQLGKATVRNIRQNLFWAFFYNLLCIPLAAGVFAALGVRLNPMWASAAMSCSSVFVVCNALRLRLFRRKSKTFEEERTMKKTVYIEGMMCAHCETHVTQTLRDLPHTQGVDVSHRKGTAVYEGEASDEEIVAAVEKAGYRVKKIR